MATNSIMSVLSLAALGRWYHAAIQDERKATHLVGRPLLMAGVIADLEAEFARRGIEHAA